MKLYVISDTAIQKRYSHLELAYFAREAQVDFFQYREKQFKPSEHWDELLRVREVLRGTSTRLIINDDIALALEVQADGVHVGQEDIPVKEIYERTLPPNFIVGATVHSLQELASLTPFPLHYIGVGPVFGTNSKTMNIPPLGIEGLRTIASHSPFPVYAIGNIQWDNFLTLPLELLEGIVLLSAFVLAENPVQTLKKFANALQATR